jgi:hypothetical protein
MAFIEPITGQSKSFSGDNGVFNISNSVGEIAANYWSDIQLVQYFIRRIYTINKLGKNNFIWRMTEATRNDLDNLPNPNKDFKDLTKTEKWIRHFQIDGTLANMFPMMATGRIQRGKYKNEAEFSEPIYILNLIFKRSLKAHGITDWTGFIFQDSFVPSLLKEQLRWNVRGE